MMEIKKQDPKILDWCDSVASLIADAMFDAGLIKPENVENAVKVASTEIMVRLVMNDYPPPCK